MCLYRRANDNAVKWLSRPSARASKSIIIRLSSISSTPSCSARALIFSMPRTVMSKFVAILSLRTIIRRHNSRYVKLCFATNSCSAPPPSTRGVLDRGTVSLRSNCSVRAKWNTYSIMSTLIKLALECTVSSPLEAIIVGSSSSSN